MNGILRVAALILLMVLPSLSACSNPTDAASDRVGRPRQLSVRVYHTDSTTPNVLVNIPLSVVTTAIRIAAIARALGATIEIDADQDRTVHLDEVDLDAVREAILAMERGPVLKLEEGGERVEVWIN
jgi:hypothetical protein